MHVPSQSDCEALQLRRGYIHVETCLCCLVIDLWHMTFDSWRFGSHFWFQIDTLDFHFLLHLLCVTRYVPQECLAAADGKSYS